ncbi:MAG: proton-conducting transporter membrane subunit [Candidatus Omnitrophica bacterium]|nr:proton-conducting transporter membrane subunit [Candidatus Omnitrophota bacterium]
MANIFDLHLGFILDGLSLFFLSAILLISAPAAVYSLGYLKGHFPKGKIIYNWVLFILFVISMLLVVTVNNALAFLISWELMSLISYFLVVFDEKSEKSVSAGTTYVVMTHIGTAFITAAFLILYKHAGSFDFSILKTAASSLSSTAKTLVFIFLLIGFGTKAGIVPLHIWLPQAHPQAPSHISSLMSGVMIKTAIYGIIRFIIFILGVGSLWWGNLVLVLAAVSCVVGVIYALMEHDLKKLLAYHSVENIGIILLGVAASMIFLKVNLPVLAVFSLAAGLYHLINHAIFKGLLFLCAGSVYNATGTRDIEKLGGLIKKMPYTSAAFLVGAMAISALPPLNGFVSEWLTLQAFFQGALSSTSGMKVFLSISAAALALTSGLAAACFVKAFGITFLAQPRSNKAVEAKEVSFSMKLSMCFLSVLTFVFGLCAAVIFKILVSVSKSALGLEALNADFSLNNFSLAIDNNTFVSLPLVALILIVSAAASIIVIFILYGKRKTRRYNTWDCGYYRLDARNEYSATAFSKPFRIAFSFFLLPYKKTEKIRESFYHVKTFKYETFTTPVFGKYIYAPLLGVVLGIARFMRRLQPGSIHLYISYIFVTIIALIIFMKAF